MELTSAIGAMMLAGASLAASGGPQMLPTTFEAGHFYAAPETVDGQKLRLLVDTGGGGNMGLYWLSSKAAQRLHLTTHPCSLPGATVTVADLPQYKPGHGLPSPLPGGPCGQTVSVPQNAPNDGDGQLGASYLMARVWTFDYPGQRLSLEDTSWHSDSSIHTAPLGFLRNEQGYVETGFPRITIHIDGQPIDMLLDTGATAHPTAAGESSSGTPTVNGFGVTSYITTSMLEHWHKTHPAWRVVKNGDDLSAHFQSRLIEVPVVEIAGWQVGPLWFTEQPDQAFHSYMAQWMDKATDGALGGNAFAHFVMTLDYPHSTAYFRCAVNCKLATPPPAP